MVPPLPVLAALLVQQGAEERARGAEERLASLEAQLAERRATSGRAGWDRRPFFESADGAQRLEIGALLQVTASAFDSEAPRDDAFDLTRMRLEIGGVLDRRFPFNIEPSFQEDGVELEEAWAGVALFDETATLMLGRMKEPFGLEEMSPRKHLDFVHFSALNQLSPAEDHGITLLGEGGALEYGLALYNGTGGDELQDDKDVAARAVWHADGEPGGGGLQLGAAATAGRADEDLGGAELDTEARVPFTEFADGTALDGERTRLGLEAAWLRGPFALYGEAVRTEQELDAPGGAGEAALDGWYVASSWVLSGEAKTWRGVVPARPFGAGGRGAWQLAARVSELRLDDELRDLGAIEPQRFTDSMTSFDLGLNWYATSHARAKLHVVHTRFDDEVAIDGEALDSETVLLVQFQLHF